MFSKFKTFDIWLILLPAFLAGIGIAVIYSITLTNSGATLAIRQSFFFLLGLILYLLFTFLDYRAIRAWAWFFYLASLISLVLVKFFGNTTFGAQRWIEIGFFRFQPSELAKLAIIFILAVLFADRVGRIHSRRLILAFILIFLLMILVLDQPDLGSAMTIFLLGLGIIMHSGLSKQQWLAISMILGGGLLILLLSWYQLPPFKGLIRDYQRQRITTFINPQADPEGTGYNILQATIAIGSGGVFGRGLGFGSQSQLNFLPVAHTDFIFASMAEAWGFFGSILVLILYLLLMQRIVNAAKISKDDFSMLICIGIALLLIIQLTISIGMNLRLLPVTGLTLPLMSYGGSSMLTIMMALGIVQSVIVRYKRITFD